MPESSAPAPAPSFSLGRVLLVAIPVALVTWGAFKLYGGSVQEDQRAAEVRGQRNAFSGLLGSSDVTSGLAQDYQDQDGDLVADPPSDGSKLAEPAEIHFSYVASSESEKEQDTWKEFLTALQEKTKHPVKLVSYSDAGEQLR